MGTREPRGRRACLPLSPRRPMIAPMSEKPEAPRGRVRFVDLEFKPRPDGLGNVVVRMEWQGREVLGDASDIITREGDLRMGAKASIETVLKIAGDVIQADLMGVKAVRAFDAWVVIASVRATAKGEEYRLLGAKACQGEDDLIRGAAIAVLDAMNRVLEQLIG